MDTTLSLYRIFYTVAQCGSISAAARHLYISQPAISKSISNLENELQTHLFERTSRGVSLTEEGQLLFHHVSDAFHSLEAGEAELSRIRDMGLGHLTIGVSTTLCRYRISVSIFPASPPIIHWICSETALLISAWWPNRKTPDIFPLFHREESRMFSSVHPTISTIFRCVHKSPAWIC